ncbi:putative amidohydrolase [Peribacillus deserti]|uniref:Amidohydrolase n=1 Tax=Peribacillus deserti TaxID=673318 RepID=A0ABS2QEU3_9BACI|nr:carbon-nitrogen hydrolase family protein [Peribacillus deserti]MBM7691668.1 putative amidohydrolase [Peribacillus deserti]
MPKILLAQAKPKLLDKSSNLRTMERYIKSTYNKGCDLVLFPELFLTGYFTREHTKSLAEDLHGSSICHIQAMSRHYGVKLVFGFPEKKDGRLYNSACFIDEKGEILGTYQKVHLWDEESKYFEAGTDFPVWDTNIGKIGIMICYDTEFPESARSLAVQGAEIILAPTANMTPFQHVQQLFIQSRAAENQVFVATTNQIGQEESTLFFGESAAADPYGEMLAKAGGQEQELVIEMDLGLIRKARSYPFYMKDRRPEHYKMKTENNETVI